MALNPIGLVIIVVIILLSGIISWLALNRSSLYKNFIMVITLTLMITILLLIPGDLDSPLGYYLGIGLVPLVGFSVAARMFKSKIDRPLEVLYGNSARVVESHNLKPIDRNESFGYSKIYEIIGFHADMIDQINRIIKTTRSQENRIESTSESLSANTRKMQDDVDEITNNVDKILQTAAIASEDIEGLRLSTMEISDKISSELDKLRDTIKTASRIVDQTNLVAVNASIEAANTEKGEEGSNFNTIADGIQRLANRSRENTQRLHRVLLDLSNMISGQLESIRDKLNDLEMRVLDIGESSNNSSSYTHQQSTYVENIDSSIENLREIIDQLTEELGIYTIE